MQNEVSGEHWQVVEREREQLLWAHNNANAASWRALMSVIARAVRAESIRKIISPFRDVRRRISSTVIRCSRHTLR